MDVIAALMDKIECRSPNDYKPEVIDDGEEAFAGELGDFAVSMVNAVVIARDEIFEVQPCGKSESPLGQAALREIGGGDGAAKTEDEQVDTGMWPVVADTSAKSGDTGLHDVNCSAGIQQRIDAYPRRERPWRRYASMAWMGIKQAGRLFCCCGR